MRAMIKILPAIFLFVLIGATSPLLQGQDWEMPRSETLVSQQASLSADVVIPILRSEPGLMLAVKKLLIRKAYDEGRILDPEELTDNALFRLIERDSLVRAMVTDELERRGYLKVNPKRSEIERELEQRELRRARLEEVETPRERDVQPKNTSRLPSNLDRNKREQRDLSPVPEEDLDRDGPSTPRRKIRPEDLPTLLSAASAQKSTSNLSSLGSVEDPRGKLRGELERSSSLEPDRELRSRRLGNDAPQQMEQPVDSGQQSPTSVGEIARYEQPRIGRKSHPYADVPSLYDLYRQVSPRSSKAERFGIDVFRNGTGNLSDLPMDLPVGADYVLGPGDTLNVELWGSVSDRLRRIVDREGRVALPEAGTVLVAGQTLGQAQNAIQAVLRTEYREVQADVSLVRLRSIRVYVVGDVQRPGPYDISALSTPLNAIYAAGGPTDIGSLRTVRHLRGKQLVQELDTYELILRGIRSDIRRLESGDTILVPPIGPQITVEGMVRRPAIYELLDEENLGEALLLAGGVLPSGTLRHIEVERLQPHQQGKMLSVDLPESADAATLAKAMKSFAIQDGDKIRVSPIVPYTYESVYLDGHVFHPGKYAYRPGMTVGDLIKGYSELLPEPARSHAEIVRLNAPDYRPTVIAFNLGNVLEAPAEAPQLQPFDTVRVFSRFDFEDPPTLTVTGEVRRPGTHPTSGEVHLRDAIYLAGGLTPDASTTEAQVFRRNSGDKLKVLSVNLNKALNGETADNILLSPMDQVVIHRNLEKVDPPTVYVHGEVAAPGKYPLSEGMTASELVRLAGGFKRSAFTEEADLSRYLASSEKKVLAEHQSVQIGKAMSGDSATDLVLRDGDTLSIRQLTGWKDIGAAIDVQGELVHPGSYGIREGERLSSVLKRAGGFRPQAYPQGAVLERVQVRELAETSRQQLIRRIEESNPQFSSNMDADDQLKAMQAFAQQKKEALDQLRGQPATGRLVLRIGSDVKRWENTAADIELRAGDVLVIPKRPTFILVQGQVYNPTAITHSPGKDADWYLRQAGGPTELANKKDIFIVRANGSVVGSNSGGWWKGNVLSTTLQPGDTIVVPEKIVGGSSAWKNFFQAAQLTSSVAIAARVATSF